MKNIYIALFLFVSTTIFSQKNEFPFQVSLFYPIGTSGEQSANTSYNLSLNLFSGVTGSVNGIELGGLMNVNRNNVRGIQIAGIGNQTAENVEAIQVSGIYNQVNGSFQGFQIGGIINLVIKDAEGFQVGGIANLCGGNAQVQISGVTNVADNIRGVQISGINNIADTVVGYQLSGLVNNARFVQGVQLSGLVNICDSIEGIPIAPFSYVKYGGYRKFEISSSEVFYVNLTYKIGVKRFYTIFQYGINPDTNPFYSGIGIGAGTNYSFKNKLSAELEAMSFYIQDNWSWEENNTLVSIRGQLAYNFNKRFAIYGGPSINLLIAEAKNDLEKISPSWSNEISTPHNTDFHKTWIGFNAGIRF